MIHQYKLSGYNIVLDVYSGSVHAVDDVAYDAIALIDQGSSREQAAAALAKKYADRADVTAAEYLWAYPPGVPLIAPGEEVTAALAAACEELEKAGTRIKHMGGSSAQEIRVL